MLGDYFTGRRCARSRQQTASRRRYEIVAAIGGGWRQQRWDGCNRRGGRSGRGRSRFRFNSHRKMSNHKKFLPLQPSHVMRTTGFGFQYLAGVIGGKPHHPPRLISYILLFGGKKSLRKEFRRPHQHHLTSINSKIDRRNDGNVLITPRTSDI
jgi:hypothetical protein